MYGFQPGTLRLAARSQLHADPRSPTRFPADEKLEGAVEKLHQMLGLDGAPGDAPKQPSMADNLPLEPPAYFCF